MLYETGGYLSVQGHKRRLDAGPGETLCYLLAPGGTSGLEFVNRRSSVRIWPLALSDSGLVANLQLFLNLNDILEEVTKHGQMDLVNGLS